MKKTVSLFVIACILLTLVSCAKRTVIIDDDDDVLDFNGGTIQVYMNRWTGQVEKKGGSASSDREYDRIVETEKKFNFTFEYCRFESTANAFLAGALSGNLRADILKNSPLEIYNAYAINALIPVENIVNDVSSTKWKSAGQQDCGILNGTRYGIFPYYWESSPSISGFININMTVLQSYDITSPHEIIEAGEWDWEHFKDFLKQTAFTDGTTKWEGLGMFASAGETMLPFILGNGGHYIIYDNGRYKLDIDSEESLEALRFAQSLVDEELMNDIIVDNVDFFNSTRWMLASGHVMTSEDFDMANVRYPYGPHGNKDTVSTITNGDTLYAFPIFSVYGESELGEVVEYLFEPLSDLYPNGWKDIYEDNVFFYHEDYEYYLRSVDDATYLDNAALTDSYFSFRGAMRDVLFSRSTPEVAVESVMESIQAEIDEKYNK